MKMLFFSMAMVVVLSVEAHAGRAMVNKSNAAVRAVELKEPVPAMARQKMKA